MRYISANALIYSSILIFTPSNYVYSSIICKELTVSNDFWFPNTYSFSKEKIYPDIYDDEKDELFYEMVHLVYEQSDVKGGCIGWMEEG